MTDAGLQQDAIQFAQVHLPSVPHDAILRAAWVAKDKHLYDRVAQHPRGDFSSLPVRLSEEEREALLREKNVTFSERGMYIVIATVSVAALLQDGPPRRPGRPSPGPDVAARQASSSLRSTGRLCT